jgi:hypothetical protein
MAWLLLTVRCMPAAGTARQLALSPVMARFGVVEPGSNLVRSWGPSLDVSIVMLSGSLAFVTGGWGTMLRRDDVLALRSQPHCEFVNYPASGERAWFVEFWKRRDPIAAAMRPHFRHVRAERRRRIRTIVELVREPQVAAVILCAGDSVTHDMRLRQAAYVVTTVGAIALNDLRVGEVSAAVVEGPGRVTIRAIESTEVLLVPFRTRINSQRATPADSAERARAGGCAPSAPRARPARGSHRASVTAPRASGAPTPPSPAGR